MTRSMFYLQYAMYHGEWEHLKMICHSQVVKELYAKFCVLLCKQKGATEGIFSRKLALVLSSQVM